MWILADGTEGRPIYVFAAHAGVLHIGRVCAAARADPGRPARKLAAFRLPLDGIRLESICCGRAILHSERMLALDACWVVTFGIIAPAPALLALQLASAFESGVTAHDHRARLLLTKIPSRVASLCAVKQSKKPLRAGSVQHHFGAIPAALAAAGCELRRVVVEAWQTRRLALVRKISHVRFVFVTCLHARHAARVRELLTRLPPLSRGARPWRLSALQASAVGAKPGLVARPSANARVAALPVSLPRCHEISALRAVDTRCVV